MDEASGLVLSDKMYNRLKWITLVVLPASGALYFGLAQLWGLPKGNEVVGSLAIIATFLGALIGVSTKAYNKLPEDVDGYLGANGIDEDTGRPNLAMTLNKLPEELLGKETVKLRVDPNSAPGVPPNS